MRKYIFCLMLFVASLNGLAQEKAITVDAIQETNQNYYDGYIFRDFKKLKKAFDLENGTMKVPELKDKKIVGFKNRYFKEVVPKWGNRKKLPQETLQNCKLTILNMDIVDDNIASAKISMKVDKVTYIDILSLQKIENTWKITNKIYVVRQ